MSLYFNIIFTTLLVDLVITGLVIYHIDKEGNLRNPVIRILIVALHLIGAIILIMLTSLLISTIGGIWGVKPF